MQLLGELASVVPRSTGRDSIVQYGSNGRFAKLFLLDMEDWKFDGIWISDEPAVALQVGRGTGLDTC